MERLRRYYGVVLVTLIFIGVAWLLYKKVSHYDLEKVKASLAALPISHVFLALGLTVVNYCVLIGYDWLAVRGIGHPLPIRRIALASCIGYAISNTLGTLVGGTAVRFRLYSSWGLSVLEVMRLIALLGLIFWLGVFALAGTVFIISPLAIPDVAIPNGPNLREKLPFETVQPLGFILLGLAVLYLVICAVWHKPIRFAGRELKLPSVGNSFCQLVVASGDMIVASSVLYVLLPESCHVSFPHFLGVYLLAWVAVVVVHMPGGAGIFELVFPAALAAESEEAIMSSILVWRVVYFILPLLITAPLMGWYELQRNIQKVRYRPESESLPPSTVAAHDSQPPADSSSRE